MMQFTAIVSFILIMSASNDVLAQWQVQSKHSDNSLKSVFFTSADSGHAVGRGVMMSTTNGGQNWKITPSYPWDFSAVFFTSSNVGFVAGRELFGYRSFIFRTTNSGISWWASFDTVVTIGSGFQSIYFTSELNGFAVGPGDGHNDCIAMETRDAGLTWSNGSGNRWQLTGACEVITFVNQTIGYIGGSSEGTFGQFTTLLNSTDGGKIWQLPPGWNVNNKYTLFLFIKTIRFSSLATGWVGGYREKRWPTLESNSRVFFTTDGGDTWDTTKFVFPYTVNSIVFANELVGFIGDAAGNVYSTFDGGTTWKNDNVPSGGRSINSIAVAGGSAVYAVGDSGLVLKLDLATSIDENTEQPHLKIFPNPSHGSFRIDVSSLYSAGTEVAITVTDILGKEVFSTTATSHHIDVDMSFAPPAMYYVRVRMGGQVYSQMVALY